MFPHFAFPLIDYKLGAHRKEFPLMLPYEYSISLHEYSISLPPSLFFFLVLKNNLPQMCLDADNTTPFSKSNYWLTCLLELCKNSGHK